MVIRIKKKHDKCNQIYFEKYPNICTTDGKLIVGLICVKIGRFTNRILVILLKNHSVLVFFFSRRSSETKLIKFYGKFSPDWIILPKQPNVPNFKFLT